MPRMFCGEPVLDADLEILARTVYGEARGEEYQGRVAVAAVILNRVRACRQRLPFSSVQDSSLAMAALRYRQFSCWNVGDPNREKLLLLDRGDGAYVTALNAVIDALAGQDPTSGATHYHALTVTPKWAKSMEKTAQIGNHVFYRPYSHA